MERIGIIIHGGIAPAWSSHSVPAITGLIERLAETFNITVYTCITTDNTRTPFSAGKARVEFLPVHFGSSPLAIVAQAVRAFTNDHQIHPYALVHGFWGLPGGLAATIAGRVTGVPSMVTLLGGEAANLPHIQYGNMRKRASRLATLWTSNRAGTLTFLTRYQLRELQKFGFTRTENIHTIPLGADPALFSHAGERPQPPPFHLLHVGHLNRVKDQITLLKAFKRIVQSLDCRLRIVGEGPLENTLRRLAFDLRIEDRVSFEGYVRHADLPQHFAWAHLLLHSSVYEGQGVVFAEAAASGIPVCGTRVGLLEDFENSFAVTAPSGDPNKLAESAIRLLENPELMNRMSSRAVEWALQHSLDWSTAQFSELYCGLVNRN